VPSWRNSVAAATAMASLAMPIAESISTAKELTQIDSRTLALQWFESNVPAGTRVLIEEGNRSGAVNRPIA